MSHQVKLSNLSYTNLDLLKKAITQEGLTMTTMQHGYSRTWNAGTNVNGGKLLFGLKIGSKSPVGVYEMPDKTYKLIGDSWGVSYKGVSGLSELSSRLDQRYRIAEIEQFVLSNNWEVVSAPSDLLKYNSKDEIEIVISPAKQTATVGMYY